MPRLSKKEIYVDKIFSSLSKEYVIRKEKVTTVYYLANNVLLMKEIKLNMMWIFLLKMMEKSLLLQNNK